MKLGSSSASDQGFVSMSRKLRLYYISNTLLFSLSPRKGALFLKDNGSVITVTKNITLARRQGMTNHCMTQPTTHP